MKYIAFALLFASSVIAVDLQPVVAVGGAYGLLSPSPPPPSDECDCGCGGTGVVGDGRIEMDCGCPSDCSCKRGKQQAAAEPPKMRKLYRMPGPRWNWEGLSNPSPTFMRAHMMQDHGIDATGWSAEAMQVGHDNVHNGYSVWGEEPAKAGNFRSDCPSGNCPLPSSSGGSCPSGNCPTSSPRRGLFGRRR